MLLLRNEFTTQSLSAPPLNQDRIKEIQFLSTTVYKRETCASCTIAALSARSRSLSVAWTINLFDEAAMNSNNLKFSVTIKYQYRIWKQLQSSVMMNYWEHTALGTITHPSFNSNLDINRLVEKGFGSVFDCSHPTSAYADTAMSFEI